MKEVINARNLVEGRLTLWTLNENGLFEPHSTVKNQIQYSWGVIAAQAIGRGDTGYKLSTLYIEFENTASPGDAVAIPTYGEEEGIGYYSDLQFSGSRDFLRVPLLQDPMLGIETGYESYFDEDQGNKITCFAQTAGFTGVHGKTFNNGANSTVFGGALVATPTPADRTQDVVFARTYFEVAEQKVVEASTQIGLSWEITFG